MNYWLGLVLMQLVMGLGLTGYLLPWDQKGYWATNVATNLMTLVPVVGKEMQQLAVGGSEYGHHTLTRFFAMHAGVLPALLVIFLVLHIAIFRRHGIMAKITPGRPDEHFWPKQVLFDAIGCLVLLAVVLLCVIHFDFRSLAGQFAARTSRGGTRRPCRSLGAILGRPAGMVLPVPVPASQVFPGSSEIVGAIIIPGVVMTYLFLFPILGRWEWGHHINRAALVLLLIGAGALTFIAMREDANNPDFQAAKVAAAHDAERTHELINRREWLPAQGKLSDLRLIPKQGAVHLLRNDPLTRGQRLFVQHCASCHDHADPKGQRPAGVTGPIQTPEATGDKDSTKPPTFAKESSAGAPNLYGFASRAWIKGLLNPAEISKLEFGQPLPAGPDGKSPGRPVIAPYFGNTNHKTGRMATWVKQHAELLKTDTDAIAAALSAQAQIRSQAELDKRDAKLIERGLDLIQQHCTSCHRLGEQGQLGLAPDLTGYGSYEWIMGLVSDPTHERFYGQENDRMPSFADDLDHPENNNVSLRELSLIVDWLRGQYYLASDPAPVLPHTQQQAEETARLALTIAEPRQTIVGLPRPAGESESAQAERLFAQIARPATTIPIPAGTGWRRKIPPRRTCSVLARAPGWRDSWIPSRSSVRTISATRDTNGARWPRNSSRPTWRSSMPTARPKSRRSSPPSRPRRPCQRRPTLTRRRRKIKRSRKGGRQSPTRSAAIPAPTVINSARKASWARPPI